MAGNMMVLEWYTKMYLAQNLIIFMRTSRMIAQNKWPLQKAKEIYVNAHLYCKEGNVGQEWWEIGWFSTFFISFGHTHFPVCFAWFPPGFLIIKCHRMFYGWAFGGFASIVRHLHGFSAAVAWSQASHAEICCSWPSTRRGTRSKWGTSWCSRWRGGKSL